MRKTEHPSPAPTTERASKRPRAITNPSRAVAGILETVSRMLTNTGHGLEERGAVEIANYAKLAAARAARSAKSTRGIENHVEESTAVPDVAPSTAKKRRYRVPSLWGKGQNWVQQHPTPTQQANTLHQGTLSDNRDFRNMPLPGAVADAAGREGATPTQPMANGDEATPERSRVPS